MKLLKITFALFIAMSFMSCASGYKTINPSTLNYLSTSVDKGVTLEYKYELLDKKYKKKELAKGIRLVAIKLTNNTDRDLTFGKDVKLTYDDGTGLYIMENELVFKSLKQSATSYLWYLLLTPLNLYTTENHNGFQTQTSSTPIGLVVGPGLAGGNMIAVGAANKKFKEDLFSNNLNGTIIKKGATSSGLIGIRTDHSHSIKVKVN
ncbi:MAG: hypothetical protein ACPGU6_03415 [Tenacibaculum sp.]